MHTNENLQISNNGWQNTGICHKLAIDKISTKYITIYLRIVEYSFGYCQATTNRQTIKWWCKDISISDKTFTKAIKWLSDNGFIEILTHNGFIEGGGSKPNSYAPVFPHNIDKKYAHIKINTSKGTEQNKQEKKLTDEEIKNAW